MEIDLIADTLFSVGGSFIEEARKRAGLTQAELASRLENPQSTVARWETRRIEPSFANVARAVRACDLHLSVTLPPVDHELEALIDESLRMTPAQRFAQNSHLVNLVDGARRRMAPPVADRPMFRPEEILETLERHRVEYILIGGLAAAVRGSPYPPPMSTSRRRPIARTLADSPRP